MSKAQTRATTLPILRQQALEQAALHMTIEEGVATVPDLLGRARAYLAFLDAGGVETVAARKALLDIAHGLGDDSNSDVVGRARALLRYVEEGA